MELNNRLRVLDVLDDMSNGVNGPESLGLFLKAITEYTLTADEDGSIDVLEELAGSLGKAMFQVLNTELKSFVGDPRGHKLFLSSVFMAAMQESVGAGMLRAFPLDVLLNSDREDILNSIISLTPEEHEALRKKAHSENKNIHEQRVALDNTDNLKEDQLKTREELFEREKFLSKILSDGDSLDFKVVGINK